MSKRRVPAATPAAENQQQGQNSHTHIIPGDTFDEITLLLGRAHAIVDVLGMLACAGSIEELHEGTLPAVLLHVEETIDVALGKLCPTKPNPEEASHV